MDNNRMPRPEEDAPERAPAEAEPQIRELDFSPEEPAVEELTFSAAPESPAEPAEPEDALPLAEEAPAAEEIPAEETAAAEELPAEAETPAEEAPAVEEESPAEEVPAADAPAEAPIAEETPVEELPAPAAAAEPEPTDPAPDTSMEAAEAAAEVPAEPVVAEPAEAVLYAPEQPQIQGAREAMELHGMLDHGAPEPEFDMSLLDDPELALPQEQPAAEDPADREYRDDSPDFDAMFHAPAPEPEKAPLPRQTHKGRPKRKKGEGFLGIPNILATFVWLALIVMIGVTFGRMLWVCAADVLAFGRQDQVVTVTIYEADDMDTIIDKLHKGGLIRYKGLFRLYADISDAEEDIKPGIYDLNTRYDYHALVNFMSPSSTRQVVTLTIPEGYTCAQIFSLLEEHRICTAQDAAAYAADGELNDYWFLEGLERGSENCLEGYLFPDTYEFYKNSTPREALQRMLNNFEIKFTEEMRAQIDALNSKFGCEYTVREIAIIASMIEKESAHPDESPAIAGVIYNRLFDWGTNPAYLNIDASIVYALGGKTDLTREDLQIDHPYNTYTNIGLTPGPISNPGLASLKAALEPESHNYYFYVLNPATGKHTFSTTIEQHNSYVRTYAEAQ